MDLSAISPYLKEGYQFIHSHVVHWKNYTIRGIDVISPYLQNHWTASLVLAPMNFVFFEVALVTARFVSHFFKDKQLYPHLTECERNIRSLERGCVFVGTYALGNWIFYKSFRLSLPIWKVVGISLPSFLFYFYWRNRTI